MAEALFKTVERDAYYMVDKHADLLNAIMTTAWERRTAVRVHGAAGPWTQQGLRCILARRGYRLRTQQADEYANNGRHLYTLLWCEIIVPTRPPRSSKRERDLVVRRKIKL